MQPPAVLEGALCVPTAQGPPGCVCCPATAHAVLPATCLSPLGAVLLEVTARPHPSTPHPGAVLLQVTARPHPSAPVPPQVGQQSSTSSRRSVPPHWGVLPVRGGWSWPGVLLVHSGHLCGSTSPVLPPGWTPTPRDWESAGGTNVTWPAGVEEQSQAALTPIQGLPHRAWANRAFLEWASAGPIAVGSSLLVPPGPMASSCLPGRTGKGGRSRPARCTGGSAPWWRCR